MTFKQHIPPMVSTDQTPEYFRFETADELLAALQMAPNGRLDPGSLRYSVSLFSADTALLMAEYNRGKVGWWVLGYLRDGDARALGLPLFHTPEAA